MVDAGLNLYFFFFSPCVFSCLYKQEMLLSLSLEASEQRAGKGDEETKRERRREKKTREKTDEREGKKNLVDRTGKEKNNNKCPLQPAF